VSTTEHVARRFFRKTFEQLSDAEQRVVDQFVQRRHTSRDVIRESEAGATLGQRVADRVALFGGSWTFIFVFCGILFAWVLVNSILLIQRPFDPYPYILLNLFLSMLAALQAPVIMMSQNRQAVKDRADQQHDYEVNLKTEMELMQLHEKIDTFVQRSWIELLETQSRQIALLQDVLRGMQAEKSQADPTAPVNEVSPGDQSAGS